MNRRDFLKRTATIAGTAVLGNSANTSAAQDSAAKADRQAVLVDTTVCIGCRRCEWACNEWNKNPNQPIKSFEDKSVFQYIRRPHAPTFTVVNRFFNPKDAKPVYVKKQCMHCEEPACKSACFVDAFSKTGQGAVIYNAGVCVGCRYCMVACPFDIPAFEYNEPLTPRITKCTFCFDRIGKEGGIPACVKICPSETMVFGKRKDLINLAHERIRNNPQKYVDHVYGEYEVGGTSWLYLSSVPFDQIGLRTDLIKTPVPNLSKGFLFTTKVFEIVAAWPLVFAAFHAIKKIKTKRNSQDAHTAKEENHEQKT